MTKQIIHENLENYFDNLEEPRWYDDAIKYLRGGQDRGLFGLYLYNIIKDNEEISNIINIGTARGHSTVCAAKALSESNRTGKIHTIDVIDSDTKQNWGANSDNDILEESDQSWSMRDFVNHFHNPDNDRVPIKFYTGKSSDILPNVKINPDLVFHDGDHTYNTVKKDMMVVRRKADGELLQVHDDCYLYGNSREYHLFSPMNQLWLANLPIIRRSDIATGLKNNQYSITQTPFPGVKAAVEEYIEDHNPNKLEIIQDPEHSPITTLREK